MEHHSRRVTRRELLRLGAAGAAAAGLGQWAGEEDALAALGKLPLRRYGRTGLQITALIGAADWNQAVIPMAVQAGVNYWHRAQEWADRGMPEALTRLPRESYFLECMVDRVGGHERGRIDEEAHVAFVKECLKRSDLAYYDVMKFHFGYHSVKEAKVDTGMVRAFERLKKAGLVRHLAISQHHYNNSGGDKAYDILAYLAEKSPFEAGQLYYTQGDKEIKPVEELLALAKKQEFGIIAMKTMAGVGRAANDPQFQGLKPGAARVKWLMANTNLTAAVVQIRNFGELLENFGGAAQSAMTPRDRETLRLLAAHNKGLTCLLCAECVERCPEHLAIADILRYERYANDYGDPARARAEYASLTRNGSACAACGSCLPACPNELDIAARLQEAHRMLG